MKGYMTFMWLTWKVFVDREFVAKVDKEGLDVIIATCPLGDDMPPKQKIAFEAAFKDRWMRLAVKLWWLVYDFRRKGGHIPQVQAAPWRP